MHFFYLVFIFTSVFLTNYMMYETDMFGGDDAQRCEIYIYNG